MTAKKNTDKIQTIVPVGDRVLVGFSKKEETQTQSGIIIPDSASQKKQGQGKVVAVGEGKIDDSGNLVPVQVKVGDTIVFSEYAGEKVSINDEDYYVISESNILAIIK